MKREMTNADGATLILSRRRRGEYVLSGGTEPARLSLSGCSRGQIEVGRRQYKVVTSGLWDRGVSVVPSGGTQPVVRLARKTRLLPVPGANSWRIRSGWLGYEATLRVQGVGEINLYLSHRSSSPVTVVVRGAWPERDLIVLAAAFAILRRRRDDVYAAGGATAAVVTASS
jgi:hypothetical protein